MLSVLRALQTGRAYFSNTCARYFSAWGVCYVASRSCSGTWIFDREFRDGAVAIHRAARGGDRRSRRLRGHRPAIRTVLGIFRVHELALIRRSLSGASGRPSQHRQRPRNDVSAVCGAPPFASWRKTASPRVRHRCALSRTCAYQKSPHNSDVRKVVTPAD
jgi:hypothetical protein